MDSSAMENITSESIPIRRHKSYSASRACDPDDKSFQDSHGPRQTSTKRHAWGVTSQSQSRTMSNAEREFSAATKRKVDGEALPKKTLHSISSGRSLSKSKGLHSNTKLMRPPFQTSSVQDSEALVTAEHMHESELLMPRTRYEKMPDCTTFKEKEQNKSFNEAWRLTKESKVAHNGQSAGTSRTERKFNSGPMLVSPHTKKNVENDVFSPTKTSSFATTVFSDSGSSLKDYMRSKSTFPGLPNIGEPINGSECWHLQRSMGSHYGGDSSKGCVAIQSSKHNMPAKSFPQKDTKHFQGGNAGQKLHQIEIQRLHGANDFKQRVLPEFKKDTDSNCSSMKPHYLVAFIEGLIRTCGSLLSTCLKRTSLFTAPSESITRNNFFVEGSFVIKFRSWITFGF